MELTTSNNNRVEAEVNSIEKLEWQLPTITLMDLSLTTLDGLLPLVDMPLPSMVS